tara:strand:- start:6365 stop:7219 length:855 start_codon:yes stop_codon:yes gene_type:complete
VKIGFCDFWGGDHPFQAENNFFTYLLKELKDDVKVVKPQEAEILIFSIFGNENKKYKDCKKIQFIGENIRPSYRNCDYSLSFDFNSFRGRNFRLPLWYLYIDWFKKTSYGNPGWLLPEDYLYDQNRFTKKAKDSFCSIVISKSNRKRQFIINTLNSYKNVDIFGKVKNGKKLPYGEEIKLETISNYKFSICFENSIFPGYTTEKLLHAKIAGTIPIYFGHNSFNKDFNSKCCINTKNMSDKMILEMVKEIDNSSLRYKEILNEPLFLSRVKLEPLKEFMMKIIV